MRRLLPHEEYYKLAEPIRKCFGEDKAVPSPTAAPFCAVEEDEEGNIVGFLFLQWALHLEPFGSLKNVSLSALKNVIDSALTDIPNVVYYCHTDSQIGLEKLLSKGFVRKGVLVEGKPDNEELT